MRIRKALRRLYRLVFTVVVIIATVILVRAFDARRMPDLEIWHTVKLENEFYANDIDRAADWAAYLRQEARLFEELEEVVIDPTTTGEGAWNRYDRTSPAYPGAYERNWNRSYVFDPVEPWGGIVLLHGLTDSPYSMRALAQHLRDRGLYVVVPRLPGHGTVPAGLVHATARDWSAVAEIAFDHVAREMGPDRPVFIGGYSNGGALALNHTLLALDDDGRRVPDAVFLMSPAVGISRLAFVAGWHRILAEIPFFEKFRWTQVWPEYDPYKYNSFAKIAGLQTFNLTGYVQDKLREHERNNSLGEIPPVLTFHSLVDDTVSTHDVVMRLYARLSTADHELVLFDLNRKDSMQEFLRDRGASILQHLNRDIPLTYDFTLVTNADDDTQQMAELRRPAGDAFESARPLDLTWPDQTYSMSHVAIPFPADDPLYGVGSKEHPLDLGAMAPRGERGVLRLPLGQFMRLRHNPFFPYMLERTDEWLAAFQPAAEE